MPGKDLGEYVGDAVPGDPALQEGRHRHLVGGVERGRFDVQVNGRPVPMTVHLGAFYDPAGEKVKS
mgnify:CR=1 FL=1